MGHPFRLAKIFESGLPRPEPSAPGLSAQVTGHLELFQLCILLPGAESSMSMLPTLTLMNESFLQDQTLGF